MSPTFPRTVPSRFTTPPEFPDGIEQWGLSGKGQFRAFQNTGRIWQEVYPAMNLLTEDVRELITAVNQGKREKIIWDVQHPHYKTNYGTATGTCTVNGGSQTGDSLAVSSLNGTLKAGDIIQIAGDNLIYDVKEDISGSPIKIHPPIFAGNSPADSATVQVEADNCWFKAVIIRADMPDTEAHGVILPGMTVVWREQPSA